MADYTKAIEVNPKYAQAYHSRGRLRYDQRTWTEALVDFTKAAELDAARDYAQFRLWLLRARLGETESANQKLQSYLATRKPLKAPDWELTVGRHLAGQLAEPELLAAAKNADPEKEAGQLCEAYFYAGSKRLLAGDKATAADYFQKAIATDQKSYEEYRTAAAELNFMKAEKSSLATASTDLTVGERVQVAEKRLSLLAPKFRPAGSDAGLVERISALEEGLKLDSHDPVAGLERDISQRLEQIEASLTALKKQFKR